MASHSSVVSGDSGFVPRNTVLQGVDEIPAKEFKSGLEGGSMKSFLQDLVESRAIDEVKSEKAFDIHQRGTVPKLLAATPVNVISSHVAFGVAGAINGGRVASGGIGALATPEALAVYGLTWLGKAVFQVFYGHWMTGKWTTGLKYNIPIVGDYLPILEMMSPEIRDYIVIHGAWKQANKIKRENFESKEAYLTELKRLYEKRNASLGLLDVIPKALEKAKNVVSSTRRRVGNVFSGIGNIFVSKGPEPAFA